MQSNCKPATLRGMNAYSKDLRLKVLDAVERGVPRREVAEFLGISLASISRYVKLKASGSEIAPKPSPGRKAKILGSPADRRALWRQLEENDTATLEEHREMLEEERGVSVSVATMSRAVRKMGWIAFKKDRWHPPRGTSEEGALSRVTQRASSQEGSSLSTSARRTSP